MYALNHPTSPGYLVSRDSSLATLRDIPSGYSTSDAKALAMYFSTSTNRSFNSVYKVDSRYNISPSILLVSSSSATTTSTSMTNIIPVNCKLINILITHIHSGTTAASVMINSNQYMPLAISITTQLTITVQLDASQVFTSNLTVASAGTSYTIELVDFYV